MNKIALGLGSNLKNKRKNIEKAINIILSNNILCNVKTSSLLYNKALLPKNAPREWDKDFINCVIVGDTIFSLHDLFEEVKFIEQVLGRQNGPMWAPRIIDIDILLYSDLHFSSADLTVPHLELLKRKFVISLLTEIAPDWKYPSQGVFYQKSLSYIEKMIFNNESTKNSSNT